MEALTLNRSIYDETLDTINKELDGKSYIDQFDITFPDGINTASTLEICRAINAPTMDNKIHLMRVCITGKNVEVKCPNGEIKKFLMSNVDDLLESFPLFQDEPMSVIAIADSLYGYLLKKYVRLSKPREAAADHAE